MKPALLLTSVALTVAAAAAPKPVWQSKLVSRETPGHAVDISVDLNGAKKLYLVVNDGGDDFGCDWSEWVSPVISGDFGEKKLIELKPAKADVGWGQANINKNPGGQPMVVDGQPVAEGIAAHAPSVLEFDLPAGAKKFTAKGALDKGGVAQGRGATVQFQVFTEKPAGIVASGVRRGGGGGGLEPGAALAALEVAEGLQVELFASEPMLLSPSSIDIDAQGRVWVAEIVNYRGHNGKRASGDRILVLEDTDKDGKADKQTVFYEGKDIASPHGITVLGKRVIVSAAGKVFNMLDENGDLKADQVEVMFTGIDGAQHDHSVHAFHLGPDGKLYFNFGNEGRQLKDKNGKLIIDTRGNEVREKRGGYQQGMIFRCNLDGTNVETLAWNFRNNWEMAVDSYGGIWQSDNDDDGNKSVRINFVMEYGNYGFRDEITGAGWSKGGAKTEAEVQAAHWHLKDPGVVPNLLHTGGGSPTGIVVYEGDLLPEKYRGQMIHCDAGPNIVRAYPVKPSGAGYTAEMANILEGVADKWFRPADVCVAPDGSLFIADWYDPGVGGHAMGDLERGRIYRVTPKGHKGYNVPTFDFNTAEGAVKAMANANEAVRYLARTAIVKSGAEAGPVLHKTATETKDPRYLARLAWIAVADAELAKQVGEKLMEHPESDLRCMALRMVRETTDDVGALLVKAAGDSSAAVRREAAISLRHSKSAEMPGLWAKLAQQHTAGDRWSVEALGIGASLRWDECLDAYLKLVPKATETPAGRDIIWRSRAKKTSDLLAAIVKSATTPEAEKDRYMRAFDFQTGPEKDKALESLLQ
jgi:putative membrane-bound dehydrogenase-like protein